MTDLERILTLWRELKTTGTDFVLATVVAVEGSSYRKPGACMLITADGRRIGTVSGGCLEAQVASKAWWLTANGPTIQRFSTQEDDGERPYGSGCGGVIHLLLERSATAEPMLAALEEGFRRRIPLAVATVLEGPQLARRSVSSWEDGEEPDGALRELARAALAAGASITGTVSIDGVTARTWADYRPARPGLRVFGAGDDALPVVRLGKELGWFVSVADGRSHLATRARFPKADEIEVLPIPDEAGAAPDGSPPGLNALRASDAVVVMTHSFEQDALVLAALMGRSSLPIYVGVLGPQRRTRELLAEAARRLGVAAERVADQAEEWLGKLYAPTGLDLGADSPETIALSILAEVQRCFACTTAAHLREIRTAR